MLTDSQFTAVTAQALLDNLIFTVEIAVPDAWILHHGMRLAAQTPGLNDATVQLFLRTEHRLADTIIDLHPSAAPLLRAAIEDEEALAAHMEPFFVDPQTLVLDMPVPECWMAVVAAQTVVRHPDMPADIIATLKRITRPLQDALAGYIPGSGEALEMGWNTDFDR